MAAQHIWSRNQTLVPTVARRESRAFISMTSQRALRRIFQLFRSLSTGLSQTLFHLVKHLLRLCPRFFTAKPSTALCNLSSIPPTGTRISSESGHLSVIDAPIPAALASQNTSSVGLPQNPEPIPLNNSSSYEGASVSCPPMVGTVAATTDPHTSGLAFATEVSESTPKPFGATDIDRYTGKPLMYVLPLHAPELSVDLPHWKIDE